MAALTEGDPFVAGGDEAIGQSERFLEFQERLSRIAPVERPVLLLGERGTGKELAAARLHYLSRRWQGPFVTLNCAALAPTLIESELFGHEKGAFTGADRRRSGRFEAADGGTLFLDEIGAIPLAAQAKILRVVEYGAFERVGGSAPVEVDVRIVGATHADLAAMAARGTFKPDLLDRLSFEVLFLPPLRSREEDILLLAGHFAGRMALELGRPNLPTFSERAALALEAHDWPGNVRELKNVVERAVYRADGEVIDTVDFDPFRSPFEPLPPAPAADAAVAVTEPADRELEPLQPAVERLELGLLRRALEAERFNQRRAAARLDLSYDQLRRLLRRYRERL